MHGSINRCTRFTVACVVFCLGNFNDTHYQIETLNPKTLNPGADINLDVTVHTTQWIITLFSYSFPLGFCFKVMDAVLVKGLPFATLVIFEAPGPFGFGCLG
jgi:hypothetical protein